MRELQEAKAEGVAIPRDLEKSLKQFEEKNEEKSKTVVKTQSDETVGDGKLHRLSNKRNSTLSSNSHRKLLKCVESTRNPERVSSPFIDLGIELSNANKNSG